jgi:CubicO group peptidase (beta-lactamase class C family)
MMTSGEINIFTRQSNFSTAFDVIRKWCGTDPEKHAYPGAAFLVARQGEILVHKAFGYMNLNADPTPMTVDCVFDIASLTKVIATTTAILILIDQGEIGLDDSVRHFAPCLLDHPLGSARIVHLLTHTLEFEGWVPPFKVGVYRDDIPFFMRNLKLSRPPGTGVRYSCPGFILLGWIVEKVSGMRLDDFTREMIFTPLDMKDTMFLPLDKSLPDNIRARILPTEPRSAVLRGKEIMAAFAGLNKREWALRHIAGDIPCGVVHDENSAWFGGVAGNAGLFSTAMDLFKFGQMYLNGGTYKGKSILSNAAVRVAQRNWTVNLPGDDERGLGWQLAVPGGPLGDLVPQGCFGHTGFTGAVIWIYPKGELIVVFLTNRLLFTRSNKHILRVRRLLANTVFKEI